MRPGLGGVSPDRKGREKGRRWARGPASGGSPLTGRAGRKEASRLSPDRKGREEGSRWARSLASGGCPLTETNREEGTAETVMHPPAAL